MITRKRIPALILLTLVVFLAAGLAAVVVYLNTSMFLRQMEQRLNAGMNGRLSVGRHVLNPFTGRLNLEDVRLAAADGAPLVSIGSLDVAISWPALLQRTIRIRWIDIQNVIADLSFDEQDRLLLSQVFDKPAEAGPRTSSSSWALRIDRFQLSHGRLELRRPQKQWDVRAELPEISGSLASLQPSGQVRLELAVLDWRGPDLRQRITDLVLEAAYRPDASLPLDLRLTAPDSHLSFKGRVPVTAEDLRRIDVRAEFDLALERLRPWVPAETALAGRVSGNLSAGGPLKDPDVKLSLQAGQVRYAELAFERLDLDLGMNHRQVEVRGLHGRSGWGALAVQGRVDLAALFPSGFLQPPAGLDQLAYNLTISGSELQPAAMPYVPEGLMAQGSTGTWRLDGSLRGRGATLETAGAEASVSLSGQDLRMSDAQPPMPAQVQAQVRLDQGLLKISGAKAVLDGNQVQAEGEFDMTSQRLMFESVADIRRLASLQAATGLALPSGRGRFRLKGQGTLNQPELQFDASLADLAWDKWRFGRVVLQARTGPRGAIILSRLALENEGSLLEGSGTLGLFKPEGGLREDPAVQLALTFENLQPDDFGVQAPASGDFNGRLAVDGTFKDPRARMTLAQSRLRWQDIESLLTGIAEFANGTLRVTQARLARNASTMHLQGSLELRDGRDGPWLDDPRLDAELQTKGLRLSDVTEEAGGLVNAEVKLQGSLSALAGRYSVSGEALMLSGQRLEHVALEGRLADRTVFVDTLVANPAPEQRLHGSGWLSFDRRFEFSLKGDRIALEKISALQRAYPVAGRLSVDIAGHGSLAHPVVTAEAAIDDPSFQGQPLQDFRMQARLENSAFEISADLNFNVRAEGDLASGAFDLNARFERSDLTPYLALALGPEWSGRLSGGLRASGNFRDPMGVRATLDLQDAGLLFKNVMLAETRQLSVTLDNGVLDVPDARIDLMQRGHLQVEAHGRLPSQLTASAAGRLPLAALSPFAEKLGETGGDILLEANVAGALQDLRWQADLTFQQVALSIPGLAEPLKNLNGRIRIDPDSLAVEKVSAEMGEGRLTLEGSVALQALRPVSGNLVLDAHAVPLTLPDTLDLLVSGRLTLSGAVQKALLKGELVLLEGIYYKDVRLSLWSALTRNKRSVAVPTTGERPKWMEHVALDVAITHRNPLVVHNNIADLTIVPDFTVIGTLARPIISGRAYVAEGEVLFRRKSFTVKRGVIDFINPYRLEPTLDIAAEARIREWLVTLTISGTPDKLAFNLDSNPQEADNDILSLILLGKTNRELMNGQDGGGQTPQQMLGALVATSYGEEIKRRVGVDILELETGAEESSDSKDRVEVTVGKKLSRRLTVKYSVESNNGEMVQRAITEYRFLDHLLASGFQDSEGQYGGELLFRVEFR